jgi:hypothetical protein
MDDDIREAGDRSRMPVKIGDAKDPLRRRGTDDERVILIACPVISITLPWTTTDSKRRCSRTSSCERRDLLVLYFFM